MTNEEALDILNNTVITLARCNGKQVYFGALAKSVEALENADKYRWHNLLKDPNDLPEAGIPVEVMIKDIEGNKQYSFDKLDYHDGRDDLHFLHCIRYQVTAWRYIQEMEE